MYNKNFIVLYKSLQWYNKISKQNETKLKFKIDSNVRRIQFDLEFSICIVEYNKSKTTTPIRCLQINECSYKNAVGHESGRYCGIHVWFFPFEIVY